VAIDPATGAVALLNRDEILNAETVVTTLDHVPGEPILYTSPTVDIQNTPAGKWLTWLSGFASGQLSKEHLQLIQRVSPRLEKQALAAGLEQARHFDSLAEFHRTHERVIQDDAKLRRTVQMFEREGIDVGVWKIPAQVIPMAQPVAKEVLIYIRATEADYPAWKKAMEEVIQEKKLENVTFRIEPFPANGAVEAFGVPMVVIQQMGVALPEPTHPVAVIPFTSPEQTEVLTSAMLYAIAVNDIHGPVLGIVRFKDVLGDWLAVFV